jgi:hypothetical protein
MPAAWLVLLVVAVALGRNRGIMRMTPFSPRE